MGNNTSKSGVTVEKKELSDPWRRTNWSTTRWNELKDFIKNYKPSMSSVEKARILLVGPAGAGKSSFFNSINSIYGGDLTSQAVAGQEDFSITTQYRTYTVKDGKTGQPLQFFLCDTMGLEDGSNAGLRVEDIENILSGNIPDKYQFNPVAPMQRNTPGFQKSEVKNMIHCVVYVIDANKLPVMSDKMKEKLQSIRKKVNFMGVPQMVILTKVDEACEIVKQDLRKVYHSIYIKEKVHEVSAVLGIPVLDVLPVKNYSEETELNEKCDILLLGALKKMLINADSHFNNVCDVKSQN